MHEIHAFGAHYCWFAATESDNLNAVLIQPSLTKLVVLDCGCGVATAAMQKIIGFYWFMLNHGLFFAGLGRSSAVGNPDVMIRYTQCAANWTCFFRNSTLRPLRLSLFKLCINLRSDLTMWTAVTAAVQSHKLLQNLLSLSASSMCCFQIQLLPYLLFYRAHQSLSLLSASHAVRHMTSALTRTFGQTSAEA
jgi:hypothetical protein